MAGIAELRFRPLPVFPAPDAEEPRGLRTPRHPAGPGSHSSRWRTLVAAARPLWGIKNLPPPRRIFVPST